MMEDSRRSFHCNVLTQFFGFQNDLSIGNVLRLTYYVKRDNMANLLYKAN